jgi:hypothetical protein
MASVMSLARMLLRCHLPASPCQQAPHLMRHRGGRGLAPLVRVTSAAARAHGPGRRVRPPRTVHRSPAVAHFCSAAAMGEGQGGRHGAGARRPCKQGSALFCNALVCKQAPSTVIASVGYASPGGSECLAPWMGRWLTLWPIRLVKHATWVHQHSSQARHTPRTRPAGRRHRTPMTREYAGLRSPPPRRALRCAVRVRGRWRRRPTGLARPLRERPGPAAPRRAARRAPALGPPACLRGRLS